MPLNASARRKFFILGTLLLAGPAISADLLQIYREALSHDAQYAAARATAEAVREKMPQGLSALLPSLSAGGNTVWNENKYSLDENPQSRREYNSNTYTLTLTQPLFRWQNLVQYDQAKLQVMQSEAVLAQASQDLILRVAQAYFDLLYAQENLKAVRANKAAILQQLERAKKSFEVGTVTVIDVNDAQSRHDLVSANEIAAENDLDVKGYKLRVIVGKFLGELNRLKPEAQLAPPQPATMAHWVSAAESQSFLVQAQQAATEIAAKEIERQRAGHYPTLDAVANVGKARTAQGISGNSSLDTAVRNAGLQLSIPLFQGGVVNSRTREAAANREAARAALEGARRNAALGAQEAYLGVVNGLAQIRAYEAALASTTSSLESNKLGYEVGLATGIDVLNAEQQVYIAKRDLTRARFDTLLFQLKLKAAVGTLAESDLAQINPLFEAP